MKIQKKVLNNNDNKVIEKTKENKIQETERTR